MGGLIRVLCVVATSRVCVCVCWFSERESD